MKIPVSKYEKYKFDQPILSFQAKDIFNGKLNICGMTEFFGALDNSNIDGIILLLECEVGKYVYISVLEVCEFMISDKIIDYISLMGNLMTPYVSAVGSRYTYFISTHYKFIGNDKIEKGTVLNSSNNSLHPYDYHLSKNEMDCFKKLLECNRIHSFWPGMECGFMEEIVEGEEDVEENVKIYELEYTKGSNQVVKIFNQKCVICLELVIDDLFKECGHQFVCKECYQNKGNIDILKCILC